ncbi:glycoside hydrolase family 97 protein [Prevotella sp. 10(H)]|uniref:glycoside hydrolase family 97 protein n=1 Tax=Prevotella sp. 10(H) TaxID=1158294 RepID=UPI0004A71A92|nr:glycoside hydrolase family 97 protein [Prevotella sp. 10(H)]
MKYLITSLFILLLYPVTMQGQKQYIVKSPDLKIEVKIVVSKTDIKYSVTHAGDLMIDMSPLSLTLQDGTVFAVNPKISKVSTRKVNETIYPVLYKKKEIQDNYNEATLQFKDGYSLIFRAYDDGIAYRFVSNLDKDFIVKNEQVEFNFPSDTKAYVPYAVGREKNKFEDQFYSAFQNTYEHINLSQWDKKRIAFLPLIVEGVNGKKICITEADLLNYPGLYLHNDNNSTKLKGVLPSYPKKIVPEVRGLKGVVREREEYIAKCNGKTEFPWRVAIISEKDYELVDNDMIYRLASSPTFTDYSWIKPGKVAWDWWNNWNVYGVDFRAGINTETYKYYIDFASEYNIEYVILDEGWSVPGKADLMQIIPEIDLPEIISYARNKDVDIILWAGYRAFDNDMENVCRHYADMGVKGFKIDFMDRDDQLMIDFNRRAAEVGAKYKLIIDIHGTSKPTGLNRTYPNVVNFEGVHGLEEMKWDPESTDQVTYDVTFPFIRMVAGPLDYTQGAMTNANKKNYRSIYDNPMSQGTRCRQLAEYVIFESPLNMLCDSPTNYKREPECTEFIARIPTVWDRTVALNGEIAKYVTIAREKDGVWYLGSMTDWTPRKMEIDLSFLGEGNFRVEIFKDGINADRNANDYKKETINISSDQKLTIDMSAGGGFVAKFDRI